MEIASPNTRLSLHPPHFHSTSVFSSPLFVSQPHTVRPPALQLRDTVCATPALKIAFMNAVSLLFSNLSWFVRKAVVGQFHTSSLNCFPHSAMASSAPTVTLSVSSWSSLRLFDVEAEEEANMALDKEVAQESPVGEEDKDGIGRSVIMRMLGKAMRENLCVVIFCKN